MYTYRRFQAKEGGLSHPLLVFVKSSGDFDIFEALSGLFRSSFGGLPKQASTGFIQGFVDLKTSQGVIFILQGHSLSTDCTLFSFSLFRQVWWWLSIWRYPLLGRRSPIDDRCG